MAALRAFLPLAICLLLGHQTFAQSDAPCQKPKGKNDFITFKQRHILDPQLPTTLDKKEWEKHIKKDNCGRTTQSFLGNDVLDKVKKVCTKDGGKRHDGNLCISINPFKFVTVKIEKDTCKIQTITQEDKHLILACDDVVGGCLPVHFEANPDSKPEAGAGGCQAP